MVILKVVKDSYSDADWARYYTTDWKSISGYLLELGGAAGRVRSRPVLLCPQLKEHCQVQLKKLCGQLMQDLATQRTSHTTPTAIREDNQSALFRRSSLVAHARGLL